jgi:hypothetical protein
MVTYISSLLTFTFVLSLLLVLVLLWLLPLSLPLTLLKDSEFFRIFYCYYYFGASLIILLILSPSLSIGQGNLRDYHSRIYQTSLQHRPNVGATYVLLQILIVTTV